MKKGTIIIITLTVGIAAAASAVAWQYRFDIERSLQRGQLPDAQQYSEVVNQQLPTTEPASTTTTSNNATPLANTPASNLPAEVNLAVPFTPQAPHANWELPYKEFCEEASVLMAMQYVQGQTAITPEAADQEMLKIQTFEEQTFGEYQDTNAAQTAAILTDYYDYGQVALVENPTARQIREALAAGKLVIMPAAGRMLGNPYFQQPGPLYHMVVIKGYTADGKFITNDPGTRRGADFVYDEAVIMNAMHDWRDDENIQAGRKVVIVVG